MKQASLPGIDTDSHFSPGGGPLLKGDRLSNGSTCPPLKELDREAGLEKGGGVGAKKTVSLRSPHQSRCARHTSTSVSLRSPHQFSLRSLYRRVLCGPEFTGVVFRQIRDIGTVISIIRLDSALRAGFIYVLDGSQTRLAGPVIPRHHPNGCRAQPLTCP